MDNGCIGENALAENMENVLSVDVIPTEELSNPPFTLRPYKTEDGFEAFSVRFDEEYTGDLAVKICSLMAEDFGVSIDGEEYSYAVRGARQTDPGFAMIAGPFDAGTIVECRWGKASAGVYTREDVESVDSPGDKKEDQGKPVVIPFRIGGAEAVLASKAFETVLVDVTGESHAVLAPSGYIPLEADGMPVEVEKELSSPAEAVYESIEIRAGDEKYHLVIRNSENKKDSEQGPDAFMNVTGSFAGELCYHIGSFGEDDAKGTYHTLKEQTFGVDPCTGYFWGKLDESGSLWAFQVEEGLYAINVKPGKGASSLTVAAQGKEKNYPVLEELPNGADGEAQIRPDDGPSVVMIRTRSGNGILSVKCLDKDGNAALVEGIEIRTLSTTAHASDYIPAEFLPEEPAIAEEPVEAEPVAAEEPVADEEPVVEAEPVAAEEPVVEAEPAADEEPVVETEPAAEETGAENGEDCEDEDCDEPEEDYEDEDYDGSGENEEILERVVREALSARQEDARVDDRSDGKPDYSDRNVPLTEKVYRSAIENYFGPGTHGIDFWDSDRKERPGDRPERRKKRRPLPAPAPAAEEPALSKPTEEVPAVKEAPTTEQPVAQKPAIKAFAVETEKEVKTENTQKSAPSNERPGQIKVSVYSSSNRKSSGSSPNGRISGLFSSLIKKKK